MADRQITTDIVIIGSGVGGSTLAAGLADSDAQIVIMELGGQIQHSAHNEDQVSIFHNNYFKPREYWYDAQGKAFQPGNYYNVGGNSKFYGAVLTRLRQQDFAEVHYAEGISPGWPVSYAELEPWYSQAEQLYQVRGVLQQDPSEPYHSVDYAFPPLADETAILTVREKLAAQGLHPYSLPLGVDIERWRARRTTPWDAHPHYFDGKMDAETCALTAALRHDNVQLMTGCRVIQLVADANSGLIQSVVYQKAGETHRMRAKIVVLAAGAVNSAVLLLRGASADYPAGLANRSDMVGRNFMNHNATAVIAFSMAYYNDALYAKTFGINDFYLADGNEMPLGNIQLLGRVSGNILKAAVPGVPKFLLDYISRHSIDFYAMSEDLPSAENRLLLDGDKIVLSWQKNNLVAHNLLVKKLKQVLRDCGFSLVLSKAFDKRTPSHQCGTVRMGLDAASAPLDPFCRAWDHGNLLVVDASFFPSSAAVNPALTIAAQALRVANELKRSRFAVVAG